MYVTGFCPIFACTVYPTQFKDIHTTKNSMVFMNLFTNLSKKLRSDYQQILHLRASEMVDGTLSRYVNCKKYSQSLLRGSQSCGGANI